MILSFSHSILCPAPGPYFRASLDGDILEHKLISRNVCRGKRREVFWHAADSINISEARAREMPLQTLANLWMAVERVAVIVNSGLTARDRCRPI